MSVDWETILSDGLYKANMEAVLQEYLKKEVFSLRIIVIRKRDFLHHYMRRLLHHRVH